jgi:peptide/nickel transport system permease protein
MRRMILSRLVTSTLTIWLCTVLVFAFRYLLPGGPVQDMLGSGAAGGQTSPAQIAAIEARLGLDRSVPIQYWDWIKNAVHLDLGTSYYSSEPVRTVLGQRIVPSLELILGALVVSLLVGVAVGIFAAARRRQTSGRIALALTGLGISVPDFWMATIAAGVLGMTLKVFPAVGFTPLSDSLGRNVRTLELPVLVLSVVTGSFIARHVHSAMSNALDSPYIRLAWAMGLSPRRVYLTCALPNALGPVITFVPLAFAALVGGTVLVESVFNIPGLGTEIVSSVSNQDYPVVQGIVLMVGIMVAILNLAADLVLAAIDPRVRRGVT